MRVLFYKAFPLPRIEDERVGRVVRQWREARQEEAKTSRDQDFEEGITSRRPRTSAFLKRAPKCQSMGGRMVEWGTFAEGLETELEAAQGELRLFPPRSQQLADEKALDKSLREMIEILVRMYESRRT
jgi:hypothetical protein